MNPRQNKAGRLLATATLLMAFVSACSGADTSEELRTSPQVEDRAAPVVIDINGFSYEVSLQIVAPNLGLSAEEAPHMSIQGLTVLSGEDVMLLSGKERTAVDSLPAFFGGADQLFYKVQTVDKSSKVGAWYFYHDAIEPEVSSAIPAFVHTKNINDRPAISASQWQMPDSASLEFLYADDKSIWLRDQSVLWNITRGVGEFTFAKATFEQSMRLLAASASELAFISDKQQIFIYVAKDGNLSYVKKDLPKELGKGDKFVVMPFEAVDVLVGRDVGLYISAREKSSWYKMADPDFGDKFDQDFVQTAVYGDVALMRADKSLIEMTLKREKSKSEQTYQEISDDLTQVLKTSCLSCHMSKAKVESLANPEKYPDEFPAIKSRFDPRSKEHWAYLIRQKYDKKEAKKLSMEMCNRSSSSSCSDTAENAAARQKIIDYIEGVGLE